MEKPIEDFGSNSFLFPTSTSKMYANSTKENPQEAITPEVRLQKYNAKLTELEQLKTIYLEAMVQASKAVTFCLNSKAFVGTLHHAESERLLLLSSKYSNTTTPFCRIFIFIMISLLAKLSFTHLLKLITNSEFCGINRTYNSDCI